MLKDCTLLWYRQPGYTRMGSHNFTFTVAFVNIRCLILVCYFLYLLFIFNMPFIDLSLLCIYRITPRSLKLKNYLINDLGYLIQAVFLCDQIAVRLQKLMGAVRIDPL